MRKLCKLESRHSHSRTMTANEEARVRGAATSAARKITAVYVEALKEMLTTAFSIGENLSPASAAGAKETTGVREEQREMCSVDEPLLTSREVARLFPGRGKQGYVSVNTILCYTGTGVTVGERTIRLATVWSPTGRRWTKSAVQRFLAELTAAKEEAQTRRRQDATGGAAERRRKLIEAGVLKPDPELGESPLPQPPRNGQHTST